MAESSNSTSSAQHTTPNPSVADNLPKKEVDSLATVAPDQEAQATPQTASEAPKRTKAQNILIMVSICMAVFLAAIDTVILTTALPTIAVDFNASDSGYAWIGSAYLVRDPEHLWIDISDVSICTNFVVEENDL